MMKKLLFALTASLSVLLFSACEKGMLTKEVEQTVPSGMINISFSSSACSKTVITENASEGKLNFTWKAEDKVTVYDGAKLCGTLDLDPSCIGQENGTFSGQITEPEGEIITFYHFGSQLTAPHGESDLTVDFKSQPATLEWIQDRAIAKCMLEYTGAGDYEGEFKMAYAIAKFSFADGAFADGNTVAVRGMYQKVVVKPTGLIEYVSAESTNSSEFQYNKSNAFFVVLPSGQGAGQLSIVNEQTKQAKTFSKSIENGVYYIASGIQLEDSSCTVYYKSDCGDGKGLVNFVSPITESQKTEHDIIFAEPYWQGTGDRYTFLGWSEDQNDTEGRYTSSYQKTGTHKINIEEKTSVTLYAIWKKVTQSGPWVDFEHYEMNAIPRLDYLCGWSFNDYISFDSVTNMGYDKINFPIHGLTEGTWYYLIFGEQIDNLGGGNVWHGEGVYGNRVKSEKDMRTYATSTVPSDAGAGDPNDTFVWTHSITSYNTKDYTSTSRDSILFKATGETMYWVWDLSKHNNGNKMRNTYRLGEPKFAIAQRTADPTIDFMYTTFAGFKVDGHSKGSTTYKVKAVNNEYFLVTTMAKAGAEKMNIPIINLQPNTKYELKFHYERVLGGTDAFIAGDYDFCYGVKNAKNTDTSSSNKYHDTEGYSSNNYDVKFSDTITFTTGPDDTTMYWIWSMSKTKEAKLQHKLVVDSFGPQSN